MEIGYAVMFITWMNIMNFIEMKTIENKIDNLTIKKENIIKVNYPDVISIYCKKGGK
jgi:hypothetical protein